MLLQHLQRARHGGAEGARQNGHARSRRESSVRRRFSAFSVAWRRRAGAELLKLVPHLDLVVGTQKFHRVADYVDELVERKRATSTNGRSALFDRRHGGRSSARRKQSVTTPCERNRRPRLFPSCRAAICTALFASSRGLAARNAVARLRRSSRSAGAGRARGEGGDTARPNREPLRPPRVSRESTKRVPSCNCSRRSMPSTVSSVFVSPRRIRSVFAPICIAALRDLPKLCEHVHLPLQSGSDRILKAMHRTYTADKYLRLVDQIRAVRSDIALTTDVIVGFPGETEEDYEKTRALVERVQFDNAFVFRYSQRSETPAAEMAGQLDEQSEGSTKSGSPHRGGRGGQARRRAVGRAERADPLRRTEQNKSSPPNGQNTKQQNRRLRRTSRRRSDS